MALRWWTGKGGWETANGKYAIAERGGQYVLSRWDDDQKSLYIWKPPFGTLEAAKRFAERDNEIHTP